MIFFSWICNQINLSPNSPLQMIMGLFGSIFQITVFSVWKLKIMIKKYCFDKDVLLRIFDLQFSDYGI